MLATILATLLTVGEPVTQVPLDTIDCIEYCQRVYPEIRESLNDDDQYVCDSMFAMLKEAPIYADSIRYGNYPILDLKRNRFNSLLIFIEYHARLLFYICYHKKEFPETDVTGWSRRYHCIFEDIADITINDVSLLVISSRYCFDAHQEEKRLIKEDYIKRKIIYVDTPPLSLKQRKKNSEKRYKRI